MSGMSIKGRVLVTLSVLLAVTAGLVWSSQQALEQAGYLLDRADRSNRQLEVFGHLSTAVSLGLVGQLAALHRGEVPAGLATLPAVRDALNALEALTRDEVAFVREAAERDAERTELARGQALADSLAAFDRAIGAGTRAETGNGAAGGGAGTGMPEGYFARVDTLIATLLAGQLAEAAADEHEELGAVSRAMAATSRRLEWLGGAGVAAHLAASALVVLLVVRGVLAPTARLVDGIRRLGGGDLAYRIPAATHDELGLLTQHVNRMAGRLARNRAAMDRAHGQLESEVARRTADLIAQNKALEEVNRNRERFFTDVSHELRTPLTTIVGEAEVTLHTQGEEPDALRQCLHTVLAHAGCLQRRIADLLAIARAGDGRVILSFSAVSAGEVISRACGTADGLARVNGVALVSACERPQVQVRADLDWLAQALTTILDNAVKFSRPGQEVLVRQGMENGKVAVSIRDHGEGVAPHALPRLFDRFYQTPEGRRQGGSGLGLAVARWIVEAHGGTIRAEGAPGRGTTITLTLPMLKEA